MTEDKKIRFENGVRLNWDNAGNCFVTMPVNNIPKKQFEDWMKTCNSDYSGRRWDMIMAEHIKAKAYDMMIPDEDCVPEEKNINPDGLLNGGQEDGK